MLRPSSVMVSCCAVSKVSGVRHTSVTPSAFAAAAAPTFRTAWYGSIPGYVPRKTGFGPDCAAGDFCAAKAAAGSGSQDGCGQPNSRQ